MMRKMHVYSHYAVFKKRHGFLLVRLFIPFAGCWHSFISVILWHEASLWHIHQRSYWHLSPKKGHRIVWRSEVCVLDFLPSTKLASWVTPVDAPQWVIVSCTTASCTMVLPVHCVGLTSISTFHCGTTQCLEGFTQCIILSCNTLSCTTVCHNKLHQMHIIYEWHHSWFSSFTTVICTIVDRYELHHSELHHNGSLWVAAQSHWVATCFNHVSLWNVIMCHYWLLWMTWMWWHMLQQCLLGGTMTKHGCRWNNDQPCFLGAK